MVRPGVSSSWISSRRAGCDRSMATGRTRSRPATSAGGAGRSGGFAPLGGSAAGSGRLRVRPVAMDDDPQLPSRHRRGPGPPHRRRLLDPRLRRGRPHGLPCSGSSPTRPVATDPTQATAWSSSASRAPAPYRHKPTKAERFTAPCSTNGPTNGSTPANKPGAPPCQPGSTTTTITDHTPRSQPPDQPLHQPAVQPVRAIPTSGAI